MQAEDDVCFVAESDDEDSMAKPLNSSAFLNYGALDGNVKLIDQAAQLVVNVQEYFKKERERQAPLISPDLVVERASAALKMSPRDLVRIASVYTRRHNGEPKSNKFHPLRVEAIINFIEMFYNRDKNASFTRAYEQVVKSGLFKGTSITLRRLLIRHGYDFTRGKLNLQHKRCDAFVRVKPEYIFESILNESDHKGENGWVDPKTLEPPESVTCDEDDLGFFRSILPSMGQLAEKDKFNFRLTVMNKVNEILYETPAPATESGDSNAVNDVEMPLINGSAENTAAPRENGAEASDDATPASEDATPAFENATPASKNATPASKNATPASENATPAPENASPGAENSIPSPENTNSSLDNSNPESSIPENASPSDDKARGDSATSPERISPEDSTSSGKTSTAAENPKTPEEPQTADVSGLRRTRASRRQRTKAKQLSGGLSSDETEDA